MCDLEKVRRRSRWHLKILLVRLLPTSHGSPDRFGFARQKPRPKEPQRSGIRRVDDVLFWSTRIDAAISGVFFECCGVSPTKTMSAPEYSALCRKKGKVGIV